VGGLAVSISLSARFSLLHDDVDVGEIVAAKIQSPGAENSKENILDISIRRSTASVLNTSRNWASYSARKKITSMRSTPGTSIPWRLHHGIVDS
jgi:hypothetical protein